MMHLKAFFLLNLVKIYELGRCMLYLSAFCCPYFALYSTIEVKAGVVPWNHYLTARANDKTNFPTKSSEHLLADGWYRPVSQERAVSVVRSVWLRVGFQSWELKWAVCCLLLSHIPRCYIADRKCDRWPYIMIMSYKCSWKNICLALNQTAQLFQIAAHT